MKNTTLCLYRKRTGRIPDAASGEEAERPEPRQVDRRGRQVRGGRGPEECVCRETLEETGLTLTDYRYRGVITFVSDIWEGEYMHLFTATGWTGTLRECSEGVLEWLHKDALAALPQWEGDKLFLALIHEPDTPFFSMKLQYAGDTLVYAALNGKELAV